MSETFYVDYLPNYAEPDDSGLIEALRDDIEDESSPYDADTLVDFLESRNALKECEHCGCVTVEGKPAIVIFNGKAMVYEAILCRRCFLVCDDWRATLAERESWFFLDGRRVAGKIFAKNIGDNPSAKCYRLDGNP